MKLVKALIVDVIVTVVILLFVLTGAEAARWAVIIYTPFMLLLKLIALGAGSLTKQLKKNVPKAPEWAYHLLYAVNVVALAVHQSWLLSAMWLAIWILSYVESRRSRPVERKAAKAR